MHAIHHAVRNAGSFCLGAGTLHQEAMAGGQRLDAFCHRVLIIHSWISQESFLDCSWFLPGVLCDHSPNGYVCRHRELGGGRA